MMNQGKPTSLKLFIVASVIVAIVLLFAMLKPGPGYILILAFILIVTFVLTGIGIYSGLNHRTDEHKLKRQNRIGLVGNFIIFLFIVGITVFAVLQLK